MRWNPLRRAPVITTVADREITPVAARPTAPATPVRRRGGHCCCSCRCRCDGRGDTA